MFDIGWSELLLIGAVALVVIGPKDLPRALRTLGQTTAKLRRMAGEFQRQFNEALQEAEMADLRKGVSDVVDTARDLKNSVNPADRLRSELREAIDGAGKGAAAAGTAGVATEGAADGASAAAAAERDGEGAAAPAEVSEADYLASATMPEPEPPELPAELRAAAPEPATQAREQSAPLPAAVTESVPAAESAPAAGVAESSPAAPAPPQAADAAAAPDDGAAPAKTAGDATT
ncbi:Sec-independent protein translocase protein TatB [Camelimonas abortus]|uniref:Sec-independent protein translocase protein TatB n=1 Tax=Camelimonas abortus TaxID=1017184 RepID=A0ABV7LH09_9HYPH